MDLDNIKKTWQETDIKSSVGEDKILNMLNNKSKGALAKLIRFEIIFIWLLIPCIAAGVLFYFMHQFTGIFYFSLLLITFFWQLYKIRYLKSIDVTNIGILDASKKINNYRRFISFEIIIGAIYAVTFFVSYVFYALPAIIHKQMSFDELLVTFFIGIILIAIITYFLYKFIYKNIRSIKKSLKEIEDFEKDNNE